MVTCSVHLSPPQAILSLLREPREAFRARRWVRSQIEGGGGSGAAALQTAHKGGAQKRRRGSARAATGCVCAGLQNLTQKRLILLQPFHPRLDLQRVPALGTCFHGCFSLTRLHGSQPLTAARPAGCLCPFWVGFIFISDHKWSRETLLEPRVKRWTLLWQHQRLAKARHKHGPRIDLRPAPLRFRRNWTRPRWSRQPPHTHTHTPP